MPLSDPPAAPLTLVVDEAGAGARLDVFLADRIVQRSRVELRRAIHEGGVAVNGHHCKPSYRVRIGQTVSLVLPPTPRTGSQPEDIPLDILYEDDALVVVNKPPGMVVHPSRGHWSGTLTAALAFHFEHLSNVGGPARPGIVHRLDRDTSGVIVAAKTNRIHVALTAQFEQRQIEKEYLAIVAGQPDRDRDLIELPIGVHPYQREKMAIRALHPTAREARTFYEVQQRFPGFALVRVSPQTGRTHQIRLHLAHIGCPVLCDKLYGGRSRITRGELLGGREDEHVVLDRQALHAQRLRLTHPETNLPLEFQAPLPADMSRVLTELERSS